MFLQKWGGLDFQSNIFEAFGLIFYCGRLINRAAKLSTQQVYYYAILECTIFINSQIVFMFIWETSNIVGKPGIVCPVFLTASSLTQSKELLRRFQTFLVTIAQFEAYDVILGKNWYYRIKTFKKGKKNRKKKKERKG